MKNQLIFMLIFSAFVFNDVIQAQDHTDEKNSTESLSDRHPILLITGSPIRQSIEGSAEQLNEYDNQAIIDVGDLMTRFPGFSAIRAGGHGIDPVLRGQSQTRINILQQGAFLHGAGPNRMDSPGAYIEPFGWDELQIIKGVETLVFGSGGPAGTLNFKRYKPYFNDDGVSGKVMAAYSPDYYKLAADLAMGNEQGYVRFISQHHDQDSYQDGDGNTTRTAFITTSNTLVTGYTPTDDKELRLTIMANRGRDALFAGTMMDGPTTDMDSVQLLYLDGDNLSDSFSEYQIYWNEAHHVMDNYSLREQTSAMKMLTDSSSQTQGAKWLRHWQSNNTIWQVSADWQKVQREANRFMGMMGTPDNLQSIVWPKNSLEIIATAVEAEYKIAATKRIKSGIRYDYVDAAIDPSIEQNNLALYQNYYQQTPLSIKENNFSAFSRYYQGNENRLYWLGLSTTVRTADATERYLGVNHSMPMMRWVGNPNIAPERHNQLEVGAKWNFTSGWHELSVYWDEVEDFILRDRARMQPGIVVMDGATIYRNVDARLQGFEWALHHKLNDDWKFYTNIAYVKGENLETAVPLYQIPPVEGLIQFNYQAEQLDVWLDLKWALAQTRVDDNKMTSSGLDTGDSESWAVANIKTRYQINPQWQVSLGVNNLLDTTYAYHVSRANLDPFNNEPVQVNEPGRQVWFSVLSEF